MVVENYLNEDFGGVKSKHSSSEVLQKWRDEDFVLKDPKQRFRSTANLTNRANKHIAFQGSDAGEDLVLNPPSLRDIYLKTAAFLKLRILNLPPLNTMRLTNFELLFKEHTLWNRAITANVKLFCKELRCLKLLEEKLITYYAEDAFQFTRGVQPSDYTVSEEIKAAGFQICGDELGCIVEGHDFNKLKFHGGVDGIAEKLCTSTNDGLSTDSDLNRRQEIYGINKFTESEVRSFWVFVWKALQDVTLMNLGVCAFVSLIVGINMEGWPPCGHDGLGIIASILLVVFVTATRGYYQSLQLKDLGKEEKKISIQVTRNGYRQKMSIYDLLPGDIIHLGLGDQVPADGLFVSGFSVLIDKSSLTGESEPVMVSTENPFLFSGTKVQDGSFKMIVTTVGMRTQWGKFMATLSEGGDDKTPLQVKLNGVATIISKIGLFFAFVTSAVLVHGLLNRKWKEGTLWIWSGDEAVETLEFLTVAVTIVVVAVPESLPLAVTSVKLIRHYFCIFTF
ncbi:hypothetical protein I3842_02G003300 [Carya illinoinensis]|uniref:Uncharacterized protein n=1 Tax=Carya illinoinensis TaxID=32201 RepID=A0A922FQQ4_CARIL|nr:hypothetical protein I3842_02G003300 [Carya illinoinensis]